MDVLLKESLVARTEAIVRERMDGQAAGHGMDHVVRVLKSARAIQSETGGDRVTVELAALLHDVGDAKFHDGVERSAEFAREILGELDADDELVDHVAHIVDNISFRKGVDASELSLEGKIVQDADRLDALGAIGIVRTIEYGAAFGQPFYLPGSDEAKTGVGHFHEKLFKLKGLMNTDAARRMAVDREQFMRQFLDQFLSECDGSY
ncbi:HD domain-containing protein [Aporhodopirellula aestuarii]|uniref:HD domain-containing protein n=1 Tax=Aporhodopirellula aestuarii TaxID=2950107 RepID=A0ABT0U042_9BACT|nr:HD domain-containing protein [Aporhodopirellula aestuarii]MCM2370222.1 HD domain-containing protein [Aporhodopirellula aestuarii]